ncbi:MAG: post-transcriptional regulator [Bacillales bacterium]|jgi:hypothetical protein|nr:post-transcriptional regulator [Bacillales bacterium]
MEIPDKNFIDERFLKRLREQRLKQATEHENSSTSNSQDEIVDSIGNDQKDVSFIAKDSGSFKESHSQSEDFLHKFNTFDDVVRFSFGTSLRNEEEASYENEVFFKKEDLYENEMNHSLETNLRNEEGTSFENEEYLQSHKGFENEINQYLNTVLNKEDESSFKNDIQSENENRITADCKSSIESNTGNDEAYSYKIRDYQQNNHLNECYPQMEANNGQEDSPKAAELAVSEDIHMDEEIHPNESFRSTVHSILESKKREFTILGYESVNEDLLWQYLIEKKWRRVKEPYRLHQVVADIYTIRPNDFMNYATVEVFKKSEPRSRTKEFSIDKESLKGLF